MNSKELILDLNEIVEDKELYPRATYDWKTAYDYSQSMKAGAIFPNIVVAEYGGEYYLVDGKHRKEAYKTNKVNSTTCTILLGLNRDEIYKEAVKRNIVNGLNLTVYDKAKIVVRLQEMKLSNIEISKLVCIPVGKLTEFVAKRMTNTVTGEKIILKSNFINLAGVEVSDEFDSQQRMFQGDTQFRMIKELVVLIETNSINSKNGQIMNELKILYKLIKKLILNTRKK